MWVGARERQRHRETDMEEQPERDGHRRDTGERETEPNRKTHRKSQIDRDPKESQTKAPGRSPQRCAESQARASAEQPLSVVLPGGAQPALEGRGGVWWVV